MSNGKIVVDQVRLEYANGPRRSWLPFGKNGAPAAGKEGKVVLDGVSLEIEPGEFVCILGHSGCGKSSLLKLIAGFSKPTKGAVLIDGREISGPQADHVFVFQDGSLFPWLTIIENVAMALRSIRNANERWEKALYYLELVGLEEAQDSYPHMLSGGMRQRAEIARAIAAQPTVLLMDEPFSALDYLTRLHLREEMLYLHMMLPKTTILFITHDIDEALQLASRLIIMSEPPSHIKCCRTIHDSHPRDLRSSTLNELRSQIYCHLGVHAAL